MTKKYKVKPMEKPKCCENCGYNVWDPEDGNSCKNVKSEAYNKFPYEYYVCDGWKTKDIKK